jgi:hypothetical protein
MRRGARPLLCELHSHTSWSDGELSLGALVDLYGTAGFDVLCVTDHVLRGDDPWPLRHGRLCLDASNVGAYFAEIERERARALSAYGSWSCRALSSRATTRTRTVLDMPWPSGCGASSRWTRGRPRRWSRLAPPAPRFCPAHPHDWGPTPGEQDEKALVDYLRSPRSVFLTRLEQPPVALAA